MGHDFKKRKINLLDNADNPESAPIIADEAKPPDYSSSQRHAKPAKIEKSKQPSDKVKRKKFSCLFVFLIIIFSLVGAIISADNDSFLAGIKNGYLVRQITNIISPSEKYLAGEQNDRINFLLLGMGGAGHDGPYLTDTIVIASFQPSTKKAALFSLPRDMIVPLAIDNYRKINSIYTIGQQRDNTSGGELTKEVISKTFDIDIHYFAAVDFNGFTEIVDAVGGIDVDVERSFVDRQFPTSDYKYQEVSFNTGEQTMDGLTALRFARSRHGNNGEGSDFARIKRQQKIILAAKDKMTSFNTLINPKKITSLFSLFNQYTKTDLEPWEAVKLVHMSKGVNTQAMITQSIDDRPGGYLKSGISLDGAYILQPLIGNYSQLQQLVKDIFNIDKVISEKAKIVVQNGTAVAGLALKAVNHLNQVGYNVIRYGNAKSQDKITTVVYDYTGDKEQTARSLEAIFQTDAQRNVPLEFSSSVIAGDWDIRDDNGEIDQLDFLIILGEDQNISADIEIITTIDPSLLNGTSTATSTKKIEL